MPQLNDGFDPLDRLSKDGFLLLENVYSPSEMESMKQLIAETIAASNIQNTKELFAIRNLLQVIPGLTGLIWTPTFTSLVRNLFGDSSFCVKGIYFDKPAQNNWLVTWHQDLMISVDSRIDAIGFGPWTVKKNSISVRPPLEYVEKMFATRIHLDGCDETNGALKVIPGSHRLGILADTQIKEIEKKAFVCELGCGGVQVMKPLLLHASGKSFGSRPRRVIHLEFTTLELPAGMDWKERVDF
jgi:hypothetical protein